MNKNKKRLGYSRFATVVPERLNTTYEKASFEYFQCISMVTDLHNTRQKVNYMLQHPILIDISHQVIPTDLVLIPVCKYETCFLQI